MVIVHPLRPFIASLMGIIPFHTHGLNIGRLSTTRTSRWMPQFLQQSPQFQEAHAAVAAVVRHNPRSDQAELSVSWTTEFHPLGHRRYQAGSCDLFSIYLSSVGKKNEIKPASIINWCFYDPHVSQGFTPCLSPPCWQRVVYHLKNWSFIPIL